jgi:hypothetical protein
MTAYGATDVRKTRDRRPNLLGKSAVEPPLRVNRKCIHRTKWAWQALRACWVLCPPVNNIITLAWTRETAVRAIATGDMFVIASGDEYPSLYSGQAIAALTTKQSPRLVRGIASGQSMRTVGADGCIRPPSSQPPLAMTFSGRHCTTFFTCDCPKTGVDQFRIQRGGFARP